MPRKRTGNVLFEGDHYVARVLLDGKYVRIHLPPEMTEARAKDRAEFYSQNPDKAREKLESQKAQKTGIAPIPKSESFAHYLDRWLADRDRRGFANIAQDRGTFLKHIGPHIGDKPIAEISKEDLEKIVQVFDEKTARGEWSWLTGHRMWSQLRKLFSDACKSKNQALRVRKDNPTHDVAPPDRGEDKAKAFLYPNEFLMLAKCKTVPLALRRLYTIAVYLYSRASEILVLRWTDLDLEHGIATISRSHDRERNVEKSTKAGRVRKFAIEPNLLPLLRAMYAERVDDGRIFPAMVLKQLAQRFRAALRRAGITRPELFQRDAQHLAIRFHDTRSTGITWMALRGDHVTTIMERVGHRDYATTQAYIRQADALRGRVGEPFPPLPECLLDSSGSGDLSGGNLSMNLSQILGRNTRKPMFAVFGAKSESHPRWRPPGK